MIDRTDVGQAVEAAIAEHMATHHGAPSVMMPVRPFNAEMESDWVEEGVDPACVVVGVTPHGDHVDEDGMPMLAFVVIANLGDGLLAPRVLPAVRGGVPSQ